MLFQWVVVNNHIALTDGNQILHPEASEVYSIINGSDPILDKIECEKIENSLPDVFFSKIGSELICELNYIREKEAIIISLSTKRHGNKIPVDMINGEIIDHCIANEEWFFLTGRIEEIRQLLSDAKITDPESVTVSKYMSILKQIWKMKDPPVINNIDFNLLNQNVELCSVPPEIRANLYEYQKIGFSWIRYMLSENTGCILGDEMGLGKTLQIITLFQYYKNTKNTPMLVIAPVSLLQNWKRECEKFAPQLKVLIHHGINRTGRYKDFLKYDVVVISYSLASSDISILSMIKWDIVVLDEAQNIKNPDSSRTKYAKLIPRKSSVAVTGTPFENHVSDIWSIIDFVSPGLLGSIQDYKNEITDDIDGAQKIEPVLSSVMIRRLVSEVADDLPDKVIIPVPLQMSEKEAIRYEEYRQSIESGNNTSLSSLTKLRLYCTHPIICNESFSSNPFDNSIKYQRFCELTEEIISKKEKVLVFTSYVKMFDIIENDITNRFNIPVFRINGETPVEKRQSIVDTFNELKGSAMLVLNPRAAGTGLNITAANHVIHYNLEWNPALEDQSSARSYRRGQTKTVFIYRLYYENTVEQIVNERTERKRDMAENAVIGTDGEQTNREDIINALSLSPVNERNGFI